MVTAEDPVLLFIEMEVLLPLTALEKERRLKETSNVIFLSFKQVRHWDLLICLCIDSHCSLMEAQNESKNRFLVCKVSNNELWLRKSVFFKTEKFT